MALLGAGIMILVHPGMLAPHPAIGFVFDDLPVIVYNPQLKSPRLIEAMSWNPFRATAYFTLWLQIQHQLPGWSATPEDAVAFRLTNFLLHWLTGMLLIFLGRLLWPNQKFAGSFAGIIFWVNPLFSEPQYMIVGRTEIMLTIFYLLAVCAYLQSGKNAFYRMGFFVCLVLALFCKEVAVTIPVAALLLSLGKPEKPRWVEIAVGFGLVFIFIILRLNWTVELAKTGQAVPTWLVFFLNQNWIFWLASLKTMVPLHLNFDYNLPGHIALGIILLLVNLVLLGLLILQAARGWKTGWLLLVYPLLYLPLALIPLADPIRESRLYLPGAWLILVCSRAITPALAQPKSIARVLALIVILCFLALAYERSKVWNSEARLWADALQKSPAKFRPAYNYASSLRRRLELKRAKKFYLWAKKNEPDNPKPDRALALIEEAESHPEVMELLKRRLEENAGTH